MSTIAIQTRTLLGLRMALGIFGEEVRESSARSTALGRMMRNRPLHIRKDHEEIR